MILSLRRRGWTQSRIAKQLGMTQPAISLAISRLTGKQKPKRKKQFDDGMECDPIAPPAEW
jgi:predicted transcriptional regulator